MFPNLPKSSLSCIALAMASVFSTGCGGGGGGSSGGGSGASVNSNGSVSSTAPSTGTSTPTPMPTPAPTSMPAPTPAPTPVNTTPVTITQTQASSIELAAFQDLQWMSGFIDDDQNVNFGLMADFQAQQVIRNCTVQGTYTQTVVDNGSSGYPDAGDSLVKTYSNCQDSAIGFIYNGSITTAWTASVNSPYASVTWATAYQTTYNNYSISIDSGKKWSYGGTYTFTSSSDGTTLVLAITSTNLTSSIYVNTSNDPSNPVYTLSTSSQSNGISATYTTAPSNIHPSADLSSGTLAVGGTMSHTDCDTCSPMDMSYAIATPLGFDSSGKLTAGDLRISAQDVHSVTAAVLPSFSLPRITTFQYAITGQNSATLSTDVNNDGVFSLPYVFTVDSLL